jgi:hypothetical protein
VQDGQLGVYLQALKMLVTACGETRTLTWDSLSSTKCFASGRRRVADGSLTTASEAAEKEMNSTDDSGPGVSSCMPAKRVESGLSACIILEVGNTGSAALDQDVPPNGAHTDTTRLTACGCSRQAASAALTATTAPNE